AGGPGGAGVGRRATPRAGDGRGEGTTRPPLRAASAAGGRPGLPGPPAAAHRAAGHRRRRLPPGRGPRGPARRPHDATARGGPTVSVMYFSPATKTFSGDPAPGAIAVPGVVYEELMEDQRAGKPLQMSADGSMPATVAGLLTLSGLQLAVAREVKTEAGPIHLALVGLGFDALLALTTAAPGDPNIPVYQATLVAVAQARAFLKGVLADPQVRAV